MADVFVSYARIDRSRVAPLVAAIEAEGWSVWWDPSISPGQEFDRLIAAELKAAAAVLVVWTPNSVDSRWVRGEARDGADRGILIPVRFGAADLPIDFRALHTVDLDDWPGESSHPAASAVLQALRSMISRRRAEAASSAEQDERRNLPAADSGRVTICVLPFANMSGDSEQEYFSDGITEDIITDLSKVASLAVVSRNSAFVYKGRHVDIKKVARELEVSHVLEGSVRKAGSRVRITAQLVDAATNNHLWAERYDRDMNDIFALQDEISEAIVRALRLHLAPAEKAAIAQRGTDNAEAYNLYLMAWQRYITGQERDAPRLEAIVRLCARATQIDSRYARPWALLAVATMILHFTHGRAGDDGLVAAERALSLDPHLAEAHAAKARILARYGRYDEAFAEFDVALRLDADSYDVNRWAGYWRLQQGRPAEAIRHYEKAMTVLHTDLLAASMLVTCYEAVGEVEEARRVAQVIVNRAGRALEEDQANLQALIYAASALTTLGETDLARQWMNRALVVDPDNITAHYNFGCSLVRLGDLEAAVDMLVPVFETIDAGTLKFLKADPDLDPLRARPRFAELVAIAEARLVGSGRASPVPE